MGDKDIVSKEIIKEIGRDISMHILGIDIKGEVTLVDKEWTRVEKRDSDIVFKNGNRIIHIEIQNSHHNNMELRMLRYYSDILFEYKNCTITQYLIYIGKEKCYMKKEIKRDEISYKYGIIDMKNVACEDLLYHDNPSAVALSILCDFKGKDKQIVVNTILKRLKELTKNDDREYRNYLKKVNILSTNRDLENEVEKGVKMLAVDIENTPLYKWEMEKAVKKVTFENAIVMIEKFNLSIDAIVKEFNIRKEELLEYIKQKKSTQTKES
ncbi:hypothetical protein MNB_SV-12-1834 [hydrothermal vent metagenome]|uniref:Transposase (putative) YhgA-like domain-containing protein n=1 Tax=hydrothermal vent metagenome TaxID=652676 RepID=A0A1W1BA21_9ZZZZ